MIQSCNSTDTHILEPKLIKVSFQSILSIFISTQKLTLNITTPISFLCWKTVTALLNGLSRNNACITRDDVFRKVETPTIKFFLNLFKKKTWVNQETIRRFQTLTFGLSANRLRNFIRASTRLSGITRVMLPTSFIKLKFFLTIEKMV